MAYLIDTSAIIELERDRGDWSRLVDRVGDEPVFLAAIVWAELMAGVHLANSAKQALARRRKLESLRQKVAILDFTREIAEVWAEIFAELQGRGIPIPSNDLSIAATALFHGYIVLVGPKDEAHFRRVDRLKVQTL